MNKIVLWPFVVVAGLSLATSSKAALGWTWDECEQHWGKSMSSKTLPDGRFTANFAAHDLLIIVWLKDGEVVRVAYEDPNHEFTETQIGTLQKANTISPTATWVFKRKDESTQNYEWVLRENPNLMDSEIASAVFIVKLNALVVFTAADNQRAKDESTQDASDL